jgi:hypothetical protein
MKGDWWKLWEGEESTSCIKVSASDYPGYRPNFCFEDEDQCMDKVEGACFWGGIVGSVAVSALSGGVAGTVIVPVAIGSGSVVCE